MLTSWAACATDPPSLASEPHPAAPPLGSEAPPPAPEPGSRPSTSFKPIEVVMGPDGVPTTVRLAAPEGYTINWVTLSVGANNLKGRFNEPSVDLDIEQLRSMLFMPGLTQPPAVTVNISFWPIRTGGAHTEFFDTRSHLLDDLFAYWIGKANDAGSLNAELASGRCESSRESLLAGSVKNAETLFGASDQLSVVASTTLVAKPEAVLLRLDGIAGGAFICGIGLNRLPALALGQDAQPLYYHRIAAALQTVSGVSTCVELPPGRERTLSVRGEGCTAVLVLTPVMQYGARLTRMDSERLERGDEQPSRKRRSASGRPAAKPRPTRANPMLRR